MKYSIDYNNGTIVEAGDNLLEAKKLADKGAKYTQKNISILDESGDEVAMRFWYGTGQEDKMPGTLDYGDHGFYSVWTDI